MSKIFLTGDTHATHDIMKLVDFADGAGKNLTKEDKVIILGDFGFIFDWQHDFAKRERYWLDWFDKVPWTTLFLDGNHENFNKLNDYYQFPLQEYCGGQVSKINNSLYHLLRGEIYNFNGHNFLTIGGGDSIDRAWRIENITWWKQEQISTKDIKKSLEATNNLSPDDNHVDYVLTHAAPVSFVRELCDKNLLPGGSEIKLKMMSEKRLERLKKKIDFNKWFCGHYHCDYSNDKFTVLYNQIIELEV